MLISQQNIGLTRLRLVYRTKYACPTYLGPARLGLTQLDLLVKWVNPTYNKY